MFNGNYVHAQQQTAACKEYKAAAAKKAEAEATAMKKGGKLALKKIKEMAVVLGFGKDPLSPLTPSELTKLEGNQRKH